MLSPLAQMAPDRLTQPFWDACRRRELRFQRCTSCGRFRHPPLHGCPACASTAVAWEQVRGRGSIFSYTVVHHAAVPALASELPYAVIVVEFADAPGVRLVSNLLGGTHGDLRVGLPVEVAWDEVSASVIVPRFRPAPL